MRKIGYLILLVLTLISCQKEQPITPTPRAKTKLPVETTWGYFIPNDAKKDTTIWIDSFQIHTWEDLYHNGVKWHEEFIKIEHMWIDTLYVVKTEAYTGADNHREDIFIIKSTKGLNLQYYQNEQFNKNQNIHHFDTLNQYLVLEYIQYSDPTFKRIDYHVYKK